MAARYLFPTGDEDMNWQFVATLEQLAQSHTFEYIAPWGARIVIARHEPSQPGVGEASIGREQAEAEASFVALSSICPHLGCAVHWEPQHARFFCPCHNGAFDAQGQAIAGPPAAAAQSLTRYAVEIRDQSLFVWVPLRGLASES
jgi:Rieske Fe-S protein